MGVWHHTSVWQEAAVRAAFLAHRPSIRFGLHFVAGH